MSTTQPIRNTEKLKIFKDYYLKEKPNPRNYLLIVLGLNTALRISDILHLTYGAVYDFKERELRSHLVVQEQKTKKSSRIYINRELQETLNACIDFTDKEPEDWLFASRLQKEYPLSRYQAYRLIREAAEYAGLGDHISCHSLRKTFGYHAWKQGTPPALLMNIYNHSTYQITKRYLGIEQDDRDEVFENIQI